MISFDVISLFPEMITQYCEHGLIKQGIAKSLLEVRGHQLRSYATDVHKKVDDTPVGGGDGMVMKPDVLSAAVLDVKKQNSGRVIYLSPQGRPLSSSLVAELAAEPGFILVCGRYGGVDERFIQKHVDLEISIGDYILNGGELGALVLIESVSRMLPGFLGHAESATKESFQNGLLEAPQFTKPRQWSGLSAPEVLMSGNHSKIEDWKQGLSILVTLKKRPDLLVHLRGDLEFQKSYKKAVKLYAELSAEEKETLGLTGLGQEHFHGEQ